MRLTTIDEHVDEQLLVPRIAASVLAGFSLTALVLAALGLYAVVAFAVRERTREMESESPWGRAARAWCGRCSAESC